MSGFDRWELGGVFEWVLEQSAQGIVVVCLIVGCLWLFGDRISARWRCALWGLLIVRLLVPVFPSASWSVFNIARVPQDGGQVVLASEEVMNPGIPRADFEVESLSLDPSVDEISGTALPTTPLAFHEPVLTELNQASDQMANVGSWSWMGLGAFLWLGMTGFLVLRHVYAEFWFGRRLRLESRVIRGRLFELIEECCEWIEYRRPIRVFETDLVDRPAVSGLGGKCLMLPIGFAGRYSDEELRHVLLHELAHLKRKDIEVQWLVNLLLAIHWFNPVLFWAFRQMRLDREKATDELALSAGRIDGSRYGETILKVLQDVQPFARNPQIVGIAEDKFQLKERLRSIVRFGRVRYSRCLAPVAASVIASIALTDAIDETISSSADLSEKRVFDLEVVDAETGIVLQGAEVRGRLQRYSGSVENVTLKADETGRLRWEFDSDGLSQLHCVIRREDYLSISGDWKHQELEHLPESLTVKLPKGTVIGGQVLDANGRPIEGAEIVTEQRSSLSLNRDFRPIREFSWVREAGTRLAVTDADGRWQVPGSYPGSSTAAFRIRHPRFADAVYSTELTKEMEAMGWGNSVQFDELAELNQVQVLDQGIEIQGRVIDEEGVPQAGVSVRYADVKADRYRPRLPMQSVTTDENGGFVLPHQRVAAHFFAAHPSGYAPAMAELHPETGDRQIELVVSAGRSLSGEVVDQEGEIVAGAVVSFVDWGQWQGVRWEARTDAEGRFRWENAPEDRFQLRIEKPGYVTRYRVVGPDAFTTLKIFSPLELSGRVVDSATGESIDRFRLLWSGGHGDFYSRFAQVGSGGRYSIDVGALHAPNWFGGYAHDFALRIEADGYRAVTSRSFDSNRGDVGPQTYDFELEPVPMITVNVVDSQNQPVKAAEVSLRTNESRTFLNGAPSFENLHNETIARTNSEGWVALNPVPDTLGFVVVHEKGIAVVEEWSSGDDVTLRLKPWGRIEGVVRAYDRPVPDVEVSGNYRAFSGEGLSLSRGVADGEGRFRFDYLPPGKHRFYALSKRLNGGSSVTSPVVVEIEPGKTTQIEIGGGGRRVVGRFEIENPYVTIDWLGDCEFPSIRSEYPQRPDSVNTPEEVAAWRERPEIVAAFDGLQQYPVRFAADGSFWIDDVRDDRYRIQFSVYDPRDPDNFSHGRYLAHVSESVVVSSDTADPDGVIDVGVFRIRLKADVQEGETMAPVFTVPGVRDEEIRLAAYRGKWVLLDFWATWCAPCLADLPYFRKLQRRFSNRNDFVMIGLNLDNQLIEAQRFLAKNELPWLHGYLGPMRESNVAESYAVDGLPAVFLIDPNGKIAAKGLRGGKIELAVAERLEVR